MSRLFGHGDLRLWVLKLIAESPRHGYEIISALEDQFLGVYSPSAGTVYPRLSALESEGLIEVDREEEGRKIYRLTATGRDELDARSDELRELGRRLSRSARDMASQIREDVKSSVRDLRREVREAARDVTRDQRRASRANREDVRGESRKLREAKAAAREVQGELRDVLRSIQGDLDGFAADVITAVRRRGLDKQRMSSLKDALKDARLSIIDALEREQK